MSDEAHEEMQELAPADWDKRPMNAMNRIREALKTVVDHGTSIDSGMGCDSADLWPKIDGVEYYVHITVSGSQKAKELN